MRWGVVALPFNPILALVGLLFALFSTWQARFSFLTQAAIAKGWGILTLWLLLTTLLAQYKGEAALGLANFLPYFLVFLAYQYLIRNFQRLTILTWSLVLPSALMTLLGLGQQFLGWQTPAWLSVLGTNLVAYGRPEGRISSLLMYANIFSAYLLMVLPLNLGLIIHTFRQWQRQSQPRLLQMTLALSTLAVFNAIALFLTDSRSAWGIGLGILFVYAFYLAWYGFIGFGVGLAGVIAWASWGPFAKEPFRQIVPRYIWGRLSDELYPDRYMTAYRSTQWDFAWDMMVQRPIFGWGLRNFTPLYQIAMNVWLGHPHNLLVMLLGEIGIPGTLLFLGIVGLILAQAVQVLWLLHKTRSFAHQRQYLLLFSYLVSFASVMGYNLLDVTIFDIRVSLLGWLILSAIAGISARYTSIIPLSFNIFLKSFHRSQSIPLKQSE